MKMLHVIRTRVGTIFRRLVLPHLPGYALFSFPKSGRTWVRFFLAVYYARARDSKQDLEFSHIVRKNYPRIYFAHGFNLAMSLNEVRRELIRWEKRPAVFLVRDPRDIVVSWYFHIQKRERSSDAAVSTLEAFVRDPEFGIVPIIEYLNGVYELKERFRSFYLLRYEDLHRSPKEAFRALLGFLGEKDINEAAFKSALAMSTFENMRKLEESGTSGSWRLAVPNSNDEEAFKVRKGRVGGYKEYLSKDMIKFMDEKLLALNPVFGYDVACEDGMRDSK